MAEGNFAAGNAQPALTPQQLLEAKPYKDKKTVTMMFQKPVMFQVDPARKVYYPEGVHEVPESLKDHWWLKAHNVRSYDKPVLPEPVKAVIIGEAYVQFLNARGYPVKNVGEAQAFYSRIDDKDKPGFLAEAADWFAEQWRNKPEVQTTQPPAVQTAQEPVVNNGGIAPASTPAPGPTVVTGGRKKKEAIPDQMS